MMKKAYFIILSLFCCSSFAHAFAAQKTQPSMDTSASYIKIATTTPATLSKSQIAANNVSSLDQKMQSIYASNLKSVFKKNLLNNYPVILALFSEGGGKFYLYVPMQKEPIIAPPVPQIYVLAKSVGHSAMATYQLLIPYVNDANTNSSWRAPVKIFLTANKSALKSVNQLNVSAAQKTAFKNVLQRNIKFMSQCLKNNNFNLNDIRAFATSQGVDLKKLIGYATEAQVNHWVSVIAKWKKKLGNQWKDTYAVSNTLYVTRRKNILFTILAQFMGKNAINDHLLLFGTTSFTAQPDVILEELTRIVSDRAIGKIFFGDKMQMDVELLGEGARKVLKQDQSKLPHPLLLPPQSPLDTHKYPWQ